jgi:PPM family protein phosphatase
MIPAEHAHLYVAAGTHQGLRGKSNEDRYSVRAYRLRSNDRTPSVLALLADGVGGHRAGEVAAELAVAVINNYLVRHDHGYPTNLLKQAITHANQVILDHSKKDPAKLGMGTTCVCAWVIGNQLYSAHVGDSRLYLQRGGDIFRLTTDHTWIQEALSLGTLTLDQVKGHPNAHIIRRFLGTTNAINPDLRLRLKPDESDDQALANQGFHLVPGDRLLLCTDGLTDLVNDKEILEILQSRPLESTPGVLIDLANQRGGHDNITAVLLEVPQPAEITRPLGSFPIESENSTKRITRTVLYWLLIILIPLVIFILAILFLYLSSH